MALSGVSGTHFTPETTLPSKRIKGIARGTAGCADTDACGTRNQWSNANDIDLVYHITQCTLDSVCVGNNTQRSSISAKPERRVLPGPEDTMKRNQAVKGLQRQSVTRASSSYSPLAPFLWRDRTSTRACRRQAAGGQRGFGGPAVSEVPCLSRCINRRTVLEPAANRVRISNKSFNDCVSVVKGRGVTSRGPSKLISMTGNTSPVSKAFGTSKYKGNCDTNMKYDTCASIYA